MNRETRRATLIVLALAALLGSWSALEYNDFCGGIDEAYYLVAAERFARGETSLWHNPLAARLHGQLPAEMLFQSPIYPAVGRPGYGLALHPDGYPALLAVCLRLFGTHGYRLVNPLGAALSVVLLARLAGALSGARAAVYTALLFSGNWLLLFYARYTACEPAAQALVLAALACFAIWRDRPLHRWLLIVPLLVLAMNIHYRDTVFLLPVLFWYAWRETGSSSGLRLRQAVPAALLILANLILLRNYALPYLGHAFAFDAGQTAEAAHRLATGFFRYLPLPLQLVVLPALVWCWCQVPHARPLLAAAALALFALLLRPRWWVSDPGDFRRFLGLIYPAVYLAAALAAAALARRSPAWRRTVTALVLATALLQVAAFFPYRFIPPGAHLPQLCADIAARTRDGVLIVRDAGFLLQVPLAYRHGVQVIPASQAGDDTAHLRRLRPVLPELLGDTLWYLSERYPEPARWPAGIDFRLAAEFHYPFVPFTVDDGFPRTAPRVLLPLYLFRMVPVAGASRISDGAATAAAPPAASAPAAAAREARGPAAAR